MRREVVITGIGMRTPMGNSLDAVREVYRSGKPVVGHWRGAKGRERAVASLPEDTLKAISRVDALLMDPVAQLTVLAAQDAITDSGMALDQADRDRIGVIVGSGQNTAQTVCTEAPSLVDKGSCKPFTILRALANGSCNHVSMKYKLRGECQAVSLACSSSNVAIGNALRLIRDGSLDAALAGGSEATLSDVLIQCWECLRVLAKVDPERPETACKPFSKNRSGLVLGEGSVIYMLEEERQARARGARIYARVIGFGTSSDAANIAHPDPDGQMLALRACLRDAGVQPQDVDYINAHGTGTPTGDPAEVKSVRGVFGSHADSVPMSATKSLHGHLLGAAGAVELLAPIIALNDGLLAPTANLEEPDPECDMDFVPNQAREGVDVKVALSNNFAFGGSNACLLIAK